MSNNIVLDPFKLGQALCSEEIFCVKLYLKVEFFSFDVSGKFQLKVVFQ